jgi:HK97 family phage major capsid protein
MKTRTLKIPAVLYRTGTSTKRDDGEMELSISSDTPYLRYDWYADEDYFEVLDHTPEGMDSTRLRAGAALLFNHNRDIQLGTLSDPELRDGKCYVKSKVSAAPDVESYRIRMDEGILKDSSVGYAIMDEGTCIGAKDGIPIYKFKWAPHEASMVTIPADITVGLGKDHNPRWKKETEETVEMKEITVKFEKEFDTLLKKYHKQPTSKKSMAEPTLPEVPEKPQIDVTKEREGAVSAFKARCSKINAWVNALQNPQWKQAAQTIAAKHLEGEADFDVFRTEALDSFDGVRKVDQSISPEIGMSSKELKRYSLAKAILDRCITGNVSGFEKECSDATAKKLGRSPNGFFIPEDYSNRSLQEINGLSQRNLTTGNFTSAGALVGIDLLAGSLIELLRNKQIFGQLGTMMLSGLQGNVAIPRQSGGATAYWLPEGGSVTESDQTFQQVGLTPHRLVAQTAYDKQLLAQASLSIEAMVRGDIALVMALKKDLAFLIGSGANGEPLGIYNTTGVQTVTFSTAATWAKVIEFETDLATANADQTGQPVFITSPSVRGKWKAILKASGALVNSASFLWDENKVNGYAAYVTNQVSTSATNNGGAPANAVYFGVPSEVIDAMWAGIDVVVNPFSLDSTGQIRTTVMSYNDIALRHAPAWIVSTDSGAQ